MTRIRLVLLLALAALVSACAPTVATPTPGPTATPVVTPDPATRSASPVVVHIVSPVNGAVVHGSMVHVVVTVTGGTVTTQTSTNPDPTKGHVHVFLQNQLVYMSYTLTQDLPVQPGLTYSMHAEWVGSDHFPFNPRDVTPDLIFSVAPS